MMKAMMTLDEMVRMGAQQVAVQAATHRTMPAQRPGASKQDYATPRVFLDAVEREFGPITWDLAASRENRVVVGFFGTEHNSLHCSWRYCCVSNGLRGLLWLNPPYSNIAPWVKKCADEAKHGARIALLVPASVGSNWFWESVAPFARVFSVGRMAFCERGADGTERPVTDARGRPAVYPKDLILAVYGDPSLSPGFERWQWQTPKRRGKAA